MNKMDDELAGIVARALPDDLIAVIVVAPDLGEVQGLNGYEGLQGLFYGTLTPEKIQALAANPSVTAINIDSTAQTK